MGFVKDLVQRKAAEYARQAKQDKARATPTPTPAPRKPK